MEITVHHHHHFHCEGQDHGNTLLAEILAHVKQTEGKVTQVMATEAQFQQKLDEINANTSRSAAAAQIIAQNDSALKTELDDVLTKAGVPADVEDAILAKLDQSAQAGAALATFLEATAAGPVTGTEPPPVATPTT